MQIVPFVLSAYIAAVGSGYLLQWLNIRHLRAHGSTVPSGFEDAVDAARLARSSAYTIEQSRWGLVESLWDNVLLVLFLYGGILPLYDRWIASLADSFVLRGVFFFVGLALLQIVVSLPFDLHTTFRVENRYGFNATTPRLWLEDLLKSTVVAVVLTALVTAGAFWLVERSPHWWWLLVWGFFFLVSIFLMYISPYVIEPLFFRFQPVSEPGLEEEITAVMGKAGLAVKAVLQVDASRRSGHSNAYFTGIGRVKRIVLYDTLIRQMTHGEIIAVLAHEMGHWRLGHIWKRLVVTECTALAALYAAFTLAAGGSLPGTVGLSGGSFAAQLVVLAFLFRIASFPVTPFRSWWSRRDEWQADRYATTLSGHPEALASALVKLSTENLSNLHPHSLYAAFYYSHPPVVERIASLRVAAGKCETRRD